jgi:ubiquinone/menaquinone biosynthesis C-methylase UbiE
VNQRSISAYDLPGRVASYDASMELMHPNRSVMVRVALEVLPFPRAAALRALDLGVGTGYFTERVLRIFPNSTVLAIDGAASMVDLAKARLGALASRVAFEVGDFREVERLAGGGEPFDVVFSSFALHHLDRSDKQNVIRRSVERLRSGGWFVNADLVIAESPGLEQRFQELRVAGIVERAARKDSRFPDAAATRRYLDEMEANEADQPLTLVDDLAVLRASGLQGVGAFWLEYREMVSGGMKG